MLMICDTLNVVSRQTSLRIPPNAPTTPKITRSDPNTHRLMIRMFLRYCANYLRISKYMPSVFEDCYHFRVGVDYQAAQDRKNSQTYVEDRRVADDLLERIKG